MTHHLLLLPQKQAPPQMPLNSGLFIKGRNLVLSLILDFLLAYLITRKIENIWLLIVLAIIAGLVNSAAVNFIVYWVSGSTVPAGEVVVRFSLGLMLHPIITLVCALILRKPEPNSLVIPEKETINPSQQESESDEITEYVQFISYSQSDAEISLRTKELLKSGYDSESFLDLVRERGGSECVELARRAIETNA